MCSLFTYIRPVSEHPHNLCNTVHFVRHQPGNLGKPFFPNLFFQYVTLFLPSRISIKHGRKKRCPFLVRHNKRLSKTRYPNASNIRAALRHVFYDCKYAVSYTCNVDLMLVMLSGYRVIPVFL